MRNMQLSLGLPDPQDHSSLPRLRRVLASISHTRLSQHSALSQSSNPDRILIWAIVSLAFFRFFHLGELLWNPLTSIISPATSCGAMWQLTAPWHRPCSRCTSSGPSATSWAGSGRNCGSHRVTHVPGRGSVGVQQDTAG